MCFVPGCTGSGSHKRPERTRGVRGNRPSDFDGRNSAQRFKTSAAARRLFDTSVPSGNTERRVSYFTVSLDYYFYDPDNKTAQFQPSLFITRETGTDFLEYGKAANKMTAGVRLKFN